MAGRIEFQHRGFGIGGISDFEGLGGLQVRNVAKWITTTPQYIHFAVFVGRRTGAVLQVEGIFKTVGKGAEFGPHLHFALQDGEKVGQVNFMAAWDAVGRYITDDLHPNPFMAFYLDARYPVPRVAAAGRASNF